MLMLVMKISSFFLNILILQARICSSISSTNLVTAPSNDYDELPMTKLSWFSIEIFPTPHEISFDTANIVLRETMNVLNVEFGEIYYNFKNFQFGNSINVNSISRPKTQTRALRSNNVGWSQDHSLFDADKQRDRSLENENLMNLEFGSEIIIAGNPQIVFFFPPVQSKHKVDEAIISTINENSLVINSKLIDALVNSGDPALEGVSYIHALPYQSESPSIQPSSAPSMTITEEEKDLVEINNLVVESNISFNVSSVTPKPHDSEQISTSYQLPDYETEEKKSQSNLAKYVYPPIAIILTIALISLVVFSRRKIMMKKAANYQEFDDNSSVSTFSFSQGL